MSDSDLNYVSQIQDLEAKLEEKEKLLHLAGEFGNRLLEDNKDLNTRLESSTALFSSKIENLEQECHGLRMQLDWKAKLEENHMYELDTLKEKLKSDAAKKFQDMERGYLKKINELAQQIDDLEQRSSQFIIVETQLQDKVQRLEIQLKQTQEELKNIEVNESMGNEMSLLYKDIRHLNDVKYELESLLNDRKDEIQRLQFSQDCYKQTIEQLENKINDKNGKMVEYQETLDTLRGEIVELNIELNSLKTQDVDLKKKGNSLFGEVEDCRLELEKELIALKINHDTLKQQKSFTEQQLQKMRMQMATLLMMSTSRVDDTRMQTLGEELKQSKNEVQALTEKVKKLENQKINSDLLNLNDKETDVDIQVQYLKEMIKVLRQEKENLCKELQTLNFQRLGDSDNLLQCQRKLYAAETSLDKIKGENMMLRVKLEDLRIKYQPDELSKGKQLGAKYVEKIQLPPKDEQKDKTILKEKYVNLPRLPMKVVGSPLKESNKIKELPSRDDVSTSKKRVCIADTVDLLDEGGDLEHKKTKNESEKPPAVARRKGRKVYAEPIHCNAETNECQQQ